jgi:hypothetical protein
MINWNEIYIPKVLLKLDEIDLLISPRQTASNQAAGVLKWFSLLLVFHDSLPGSSVAGASLRT